MANTTNLLEALSAYQGDQLSLERFVGTAKQELGEAWTDEIYQTLPNLPTGLKEKLDHAFQYHGASLAWAEIQGYFTGTTPLDVETVSSRIDILRERLKFFGEPGENAVQKLEEKIEQEKTNIPAVSNPTPIDETDSVASKTTEEEVNSSFIGESSLQDDSDQIEEFSKNPSIVEAEETMMEGPVSLNEPTDTINEDLSLYDQESASIPAEGADTSYPAEEEFIEEENTQSYYEDPNNYIENNTDTYSNEEYIDENTYASSENYPDEQNDDLNYAQEDYQDTEYQDEPYQDEAYQGEEYIETEYEGNQQYLENDTYQSEYDTDSYNEEYIDNETYYDDAYQEEAYQNTGLATEESFDGSLEDLESPFWKTPVYEQQKTETNEEFMARKVFHQLDFLTAVRCWINARCISLGNKEIYTYRHYGFLIDVMEESKKDLEVVLASPTFYPAIEQVRVDGLKQLQSFLKSLESDLQTAYDNLPSELTDLISDSTDVSDLKKMLGSLDTSNKPELLGAAPDGFEMLDDPFVDIDTEKKQITSSQKEENGIQKKKTFSFNKKTAS